MRILIAEDETIIRLDLRELLERAGFEVCAEARDGAEAVELARAEQPDLAVLDVKMPQLDGIEAARRILDERPIPIVMLTAYGQQELVSRADLIVFCRERIGYKAPEEIVFLDEMPLNPTGKIDRAGLKKMAEDHLHPHGLDES